MADISKAQKAAKRFFVQNVLPGIFWQPFAPRKLKLECGGQFAYDGVSTDRTIIECVSTSEGITHSGNYATAKVMKLAKYVLMMLYTPTVKLRVLALTKKSMVEAVEKMPAEGRFPPASMIRVVHTPLSGYIQAELQKVRGDARAKITTTAMTKPEDCLFSV